MKKIIAIFGLPGSGKSTYIEENFKNELILDDITVLARDKGLKEFLLDMKNLSKNRDIVIADPMLCLKKNQEYLKKTIKDIFPYYSIDWIFIDTPEDVAKIRAVHKSQSTHLLLKNKINVEGLENLTVIRGLEYGKRNHQKI